MNIEEVSEILSSFGLLGLLAPQHIFITDEKIYEKGSNKRFRGLSPKKKRGVMVLSRDADSSTVPHEWLHAMTGAGELLAYPFGKLFSFRYEFRKKFAFRDRTLLKIRYKKEEVRSEYKGRIEHYILDRFE